MQPEGKSEKGEREWWVYVSLGLLLVVYESDNLPLIRIFYNKVGILDGVWLWRIYEGYSQEMMGWFNRKGLLSVLPVFADLRV